MTSIENYPGLREKRGGSRDREGAVPLCSALPSQGPIWSAASRPGAQRHSNMGLLESVQRRAVKMIRDLEHLPYKDRLTELDLFSMGKSAIRHHWYLPEFKR